MSHAKMGYHTVERKLFRYTTESVPERVEGNCTFPAHNTTRSHEDGAERVTVDVSIDLPAIIERVCQMAAGTKHGKSILLGGLVAGRVVARERVR